VAQLNDAPFNHSAEEGFRKQQKRVSEKLPNICPISVLKLNRNGAVMYQTDTV
jgi:hypothetical protein